MKPTHRTAEAYPQGIDCVWLASDRDGRVAAFVTAGEGPVPESALADAAVELSDIEDRLNELPPQAQARLFVSIPEPESFVALAQRGLYVYDWTDAHRPSSAARNAYQRVAAPTAAIAVDALPEDLAAVARSACFAGITFDVDDAVDVRTHPRCADGA